MTRQDFILKWLFYALALLPVWWMDTFVLGRFPVLGVAPMLLPVAAVAVAVLEGALAGAASAWRWASCATRYISAATAF